MTATEVNIIANDMLSHIVRLKADRRAELKAQEEEAARRAAEAVQLDAQQFAEAVARALTDAGIGWFAVYSTGRFEDWRCDDGRGRWAAFAVPGHRRIELCMEWRAGEWRVMRPEDGSAWRVDNGLIGGAHVAEIANVADALIAAEIDPGKEPIPF